MFKRLILLYAISLTACTPDPGNARNFRAIFDHYRTAENVMAISFPPGLAMLVMGDNPDQQDTRELMQDLSAFHMMIIEGGEGNQTGKAIIADIKGFTQRLGFEELLRIQSDDKNIFIRILESDGFVREAIVIFGQDEELFILDLKGNINLDHFVSLAENGTLESLSILNDLNL